MSLTAFGVAGASGKTGGYQFIEGEASHRWFGLPSFGFAFIGPLSHMLVG